MTSARALLCVCFAVGSLTACAQLLGGPFDSAGDASVGFDASIAADAHAADAPLDVGEARDANADATVDVLSESSTVDSAACFSTGCTDNSGCMSMCSASDGQFACCALTAGTTSGLCVYSATACGSKPLCAGCWQGGICELGTLPSACGSAGEICEVCGPTCGSYAGGGCPASTPLYGPGCNEGHCDAGTRLGCCPSVCIADASCF